MFVTDISSNTGDTGYDLPDLAIPTSKKNKRWIEKCMDTLENIGVRYLSDFYYRYGDVERIVKGGYKYKDYTKSSMFVSELEYWRSQAENIGEIHHYPFIEPLINQLVIDYIKKPNPFIITAEDEFSVNDYIETQTDLLWETVKNSINKRIEVKAAEQGIDVNKQDFKSQEEAQQYQEQIGQFFDENTPQRIKEYMGTSYKPMYILWAEKTNKESELRFDFEDKFTETLTHLMYYGRCFIHHRVGYDFYDPQVWHPKNTFTSINYTKKHVDTGDYVGHIDYYTPNDIIVNWGSKLTEKQKREITRSGTSRSGVSEGSNYGKVPSLQSWAQQGGGELKMLPHQSYYPYENARFLQDNLGVDLGVTDWFGETLNTTPTFLEEGHFRNDLILVMECYWTAYQKVGYITMLDEETGNIISDLVTDDILDDYLKENNIKTLRSVTLEEHERNPQPDTIVWDYIEEIRHGIKIRQDNTDLKEDLYIDGEVVEFNLYGESDVYGKRLPVTGLVLEDSIASRMSPYQADYNLALNTARNNAERELGVFFLFDMAYLPKYLKDVKADERLGEMFEIVREVGVLEIDSSNPEAARSKFNQFTAINMDMTKVIMGKYQMAQNIKQMAFQVIGLSPERLGMTVEQRTATGIEVANSASYSQTEMWYKDFSIFQNRTREIHLNIAQFAKQNGMDNTVFFKDEDMYQHFLKISDPNLPLRKFRIYAQNNSERRSNLEKLKQMFLSDNTIPKDISIIADVMNTDSFVKIKQIARQQRLEAERMQQQQSEQQQALIEQQKNAEIEQKQIDHKIKMEQISLKGEIDLRRQALLASGFSDDKDINQNKIPDITEQLDLAIKEMRNKADVAINQQRNEIQKAANESNNTLAQKKLLLEEKKIAMDEKKIDTQLEIARTNKNRYDRK